MYNRSLESLICISLSFMVFCGKPKPSEKVDPQIQFRLLAAARHGDLSALKSALNAGAHVSAEGAASDPAKKLDFNSNDTALMISALYCQDQIVDFLLSEYPEISKIQRGEALKRAARNNCFKTIPRLLEAGADVNAYDTGHNDFSPLMEASRGGNTEAVEILLARGAAVDFRDLKTGSGETALILAAQHRFPSTVKVLLAKGASVKIRTEPIMTDPSASRLGRTALLASFDENQYGYTAKAHMETIKLLVAAGADINAKDNCGRNALALAKKHGYPDVIPLLKELGAVESPILCNDPFEGESDHHDGH